MSTSYDTGQYPDVKANISAVGTARKTLFIGITAPSTTTVNGVSFPETGKSLWLDTSATPPILKYWDGTNWDSMGPDFTDYVRLLAQAEVRFADSDSSHYVGFKAPATVSANKIWTLPSADGTTNQALTTDGSGVLSFANATYNSFYTTVKAETLVLGQRFIEFFGGKSLDITHKWSERNVQGTGTFTLIDAANEGYEITTTTTASDESQIDLNAKNQFSETASEIICVAKRTTTNSRLSVGFENDSTKAHHALYQDDTGQTFKGLQTKDGTTQTFTASDVALGTAFTTARVVCGASDIKLYINGVLKVTKTTNRPAANLEPVFSMLSGGGNVATGRIRYLEAYNV